MTIERFRELWNNYRKASAEADKADDAWDKDPENRELEKRFDEAYKAEYTAHMECVKALCELLHIDERTAYLMATKREHEINTLLAQMQ